MKLINRSTNTKSINWFSSSNSNREIESVVKDFKDLIDGYESIVRDFPMPNYQVSIVHGQMKPIDKEFEMQRFVKGETQIMVATTVIEVGVNVPNASDRSLIKEAQINRI